MRVSLGAREFVTRGRIAREDLGAKLDDGS
jgi:hypothetical protein